MSQLNQKISQMIRQQEQELAEEIVTYQYQLQPELWKPYGEAGRQKGIQDTQYHLSYLSEAIAASDPSLFTDYITWVKELFTHIRLPQETLETTLRCMELILEEKFSPKMETVVQEYLEAGLAQLSISSSSSVAHTKKTLSPLAQEYLDLLLEGKRHSASQLILKAVETDTPVKDIYLNVFQPVQHEIGRLWQTNEIGVAQEHYCTAATQLVMSQLYPYIFSNEKRGHRMVATCVGGELHEIGIRMVADFFEMEGWDTYYLGANTPQESILDTIIDREADILALSTTMTFHVNLTTELIRYIRQANLKKQPKILVGGYPFNLSSDLWHQIGADGHAYDAQQAVDLANQMVWSK